MQALLDVIVPVFLVIGAGAFCAWRGLFGQNAVDGLMLFAQSIAVPALLFRAISSLHLGEHFDPFILISFYSGSISCFTLGMLTARFIFDRDWEDSVAIGFTCLFANSLLLGLAITDRAYGADALQGNYLIIALHSPICYTIGITAMEIARARGTAARALPAKVLSAILRNTLVIAIALGALVNLSGLHLPDPATEALDMLAGTALPAALFAMGGVLLRYRPQADGRIIAFVCFVTLGLHPAITWSIGSLTGISTPAFRSAVLTAAMAPGINAYIFANMYGRARKIAASSVLIATMISIITAWAWLEILP